MEQQLANGNKKPIQTGVGVEAAVVIAYRAIVEAALALGIRFDFKLLRKIPPGAFFPPPKVYSRLLYFKPKANVQLIPDEQLFWKFIKICRFK